MKGKQKSQDMKERKNGRKFTGIWQTPKLLERISELIEKRILKNQSGIDNIISAVNKEFFSNSDEKMSRVALLRQLDEIIWTQDRLKLITEYVRLRLDFDRIYEVFDFLPKEITEKKIKKLRGSVDHKQQADVFSEAGIGRLTISKEITETVRVSLKSATVRDPFVIPVKDKDKFHFMVINGPLIGSEYSPVMKENVVRNALEYATTKDDSFIVLPGGLLSLDVRKIQSELTIHRARISGLSFKADVIDSRYRDEAEFIRRTLPSDMVGFENLRERFLNLMAGWKKISRDKFEKPIYSRPIYIMFGRTEEEIIEAAARAEIAYIVEVQRNRIRNERRGLEKIFQYGMKENSSQKVLNALQKEIEKLLAKEKRMVQTNVADEDRKRFFDILRSWTVAMIEHAIPNSKVISQGTAFCSVDGKVFEFHQDREQGPTTRLLDQFIRKNAGRRALDGTLPDNVFLINAHSVNYRFAMVEKVENGKRKSTYVYQLPVALNKRFLLDQLKDVIRKASPLEKLLRHEQFEPGVFRLEYNKGIYIPEVLSINTLIERTSDKGPTILEKKLKLDSYIYDFVTSDEHCGHPWKEFYYYSNLGSWFGQDEAVMQILREAYIKTGKLLPIHMFMSLGDQGTGHNFETQFQPHPRLTSYERLQREFDVMLASARKLNHEGAIRKLQGMQKMTLEQIRLNGIHWPQYQFRQYFNRVLVPNADFFSAVVQRSLKAGVKVIGIGEKLYNRSDARDIGIITFQGGNHFDRTVESVITEGFFYAEKVIDLLLQDKKLGLSRDELERIVRAPLHGNTQVGYGLIKGGDKGYEWGVSIRHAPAKKSPANGDPLAEEAKGILTRADWPGGLFTGRKVIHISADIHRFGVIHMTDAIVLSNAAGAGNDPYGERGFSSNNIGSMVIGMPVGGPDYGPVKPIIFNHDFVRSYLESPWKIDWDEIFTNPL
ncbi:MAG: hypothetical protein QMD65_03410 [Patescibacteria group bacterium]|nr:hypothetical protein [Patescibacteria group bacterium]